MPPLVSVRTFAAAEWPLYKDLRLRALADAPEAFGSTFAREAARPEAEWASRLAAGASSAWDLPLLAEADGQPAGLAWGRIEETDLETAHLYQVWVAPEYRRRGAGQLLLQTVIRWAADRGAAYLALTVTARNSPALRLYTRTGFEPSGPPEPLRPGSELLEQPLRLRLGNRSA